MRLADWMERLEDAYAGVRAADGRTPLVREVRGMATLKAAAEQPDSLAANSAFVAPGADSKADSAGPAQLTRRRMLVVIALRDPSDRLGGDRLDDLERAIDVAQRALVGWRPKESAGPALYEGGTMLDFARRSVWWQLEFSVPVLLRGNC